MTAIKGGMIHQPRSKSSPNEVFSIEASAQLLDDLSQIVRILLDDLPNLRGARRLGLDWVFIRARLFVGWFHPLLAPGEPT